MENLDLQNHFPSGDCLQNQSTRTEWFIKAYVPSIAARSELQESAESCSQPEPHSHPRRTNIKAWSILLRQVRTEPSNFGLFHNIRVQQKEEAEPPQRRYHRPVFEIVC
jgi:hypothetical protein